MPTDMSSSVGLSDLASQVANAFLKAFGDQPGFRLAHAKGIICHGTFTPLPAAAEISKAEHLRGGSFPVIARFSDGTGLPNIPDNDPNGNPKGLALRFMMPDGKVTDIVANGLEGFVASTPEEFLAFFQAVLSSPPNGPKPSPLEKFLGAHPATAAFLGQPNPTPASFATQGYFGNNSFIFTNAQGQSRAIRYQIVPSAGPKHLDSDAAAKQTPNFLFDEIKDRLSRGPAEFKLIAQIAEKEDRTDNAMVLWPASRRKVELGTIRLTSIDPKSDEVQKASIFDPTHLVDGISLSDDPLPAFRAAVYSISFARRQK